MLAPLHSHWKEVAGWVLGNVNRKYHKAASGLIGMVSPEERLHTSLPGFHRHIALDAHPESPAKRLLDLEDPPPQTLYDFARRDARVRQYLASRSPVAPDKRLSLYSFTRRCRKEWLADAENVGKLGSYILRRSNDLSDACLSAKNDYQRRLAIKWRTNTFHPRRPCLCEDTFLRSHVDTCFLPLSRRIVTEETDDGWDALMDRRERDMAERNLDRSYTTIDTLLNSPDWFAGVKILHKLRKWSKGEVWIGRYGGYDDEAVSDELGEREETEEMLPTGA